MVAIILVVLGVGVNKVPAVPVPPTADKNATDAKNDNLPTAITATTIRHWLALQTPGDRPATNQWLNFKQVMTTMEPAPGEQALTPLKLSVRRLPPKLAEVFQNDLDAGAAKQDLPSLDATRLLAIYDDVEALGYYDHWLNAYLWRRTACSDPRQMAEVYLRMVRHARVTDTLILANGEVKPMVIRPGAWRTKSGRPLPPLIEEKSVGEMLEATKRIYPTMEGGTWNRDGIALFSVAKDSPTPVLLRAGRKQPLANGATIRFGRLDLMETPAGEKPVSLEHAWLGRITVPADRTISVWQLPSLLSDEGQKKLRQAVTDALNGDEGAADRLEQALPLTHAAVRAGVADLPSAKSGAAAAPDAGVVR